MVAPDASEEDGKMGIIWTIIIGFVAGLIAKFIMPGPNEPSGFNHDDEESSARSWPMFWARRWAGMGQVRARG